MDRALKRLAKLQRRLSRERKLERELNDELDAVLAKYLVQPLQAPAGAGKTHSLKGLRAAAHRATKEVLVLAPTGKAVDEAMPGPTAELATIARELLAGPIGALAGSHRGSIELVSVVGLNVTVRMSGACRGCSASSSTLRDKLQCELRSHRGHRSPSPLRSSSEPDPKRRA